jgi:SAM-dependent methyltransferase
MSVRVFKQIMNYLNIDFGKFKFIDLGSGKGRVLLVASDYGFKRVIGVEFAQELHRTANENVEIYERYTQKPSNIQTICMDATGFPIPEGPVVIFFYSPFKGRIMKEILNNVSKSFAATPREIVLVFYGRNPKSIGLLRATGFECRELEIRSDWSRFIPYRALLLTSPQ